MAAVVIQAALGHVATDSGGSWRSVSQASLAENTFVSNISCAGLDNSSKKCFLERSSGNFFENSLCSSSRSWDMRSYRPRRSFRYAPQRTSTRATAGAPGSAIQEIPTSSLNGALQRRVGTESAHLQTMQVVDSAYSVKEQVLSKPDSGPQMGLTDDGVLFQEKFVIRCYEVGTTRTASMETIANLLQEVACNHAQSVGFSTDGFATTPIMRERSLIWVTTRMHIKVDKYPVWGDTVEIETWFQGEAKVETRRDWIIREDSPSRRIIGRATSTWVMMSMATRRLVRIADDVKAEYMPFVPKPERWAFPEDKNRNIKKIRQVEDPATYMRPNLMPRRNDLDMNQHVNNVTYIGWMLEGLPHEVIDTHELAEITLVYRRECNANDVVEILVSPNAPETATLTNSLVPSKMQQLKVNGTQCSGIAHTDNSTHTNSPTELYPQLEFLHLLRTMAGGVEINRGLTKWRRRLSSKTSGQ